MLRISPVFKRIVEYVSLGFRIIILRGGTSSTKTYSVLQYLNLRAKKYPGELTDITAPDVPSLDRGVLTDITSGGIATSLGIPWDNVYNSSKRTASIGRSTIRFPVFDSVLKARGGRRNNLYVNECDGFTWEIIEQLILRTNGLSFLDFNPTSEFWITEKSLKNPKYKDIAVEDVSTYKDNPFLSQSIIDYIESRRGDGTNNFWRVYGMGEYGVHEGLVFTNVEVRDFDKGNFPKRYDGIDWGFATDAFAYVSRSVQDDFLYICDEIYKHGAFNNETAPLVKEIAGARKILCDSARPEAIAEYKKFYGLNAIGAKKGTGSVEAGYFKLQSFAKIIIHPSCVNIAKELKTLSYRKDRKLGTWTSEIDTTSGDHCIDALRYAIEDLTLVRKDIRVIIDKMANNMQDFNNDTEYVPNGDTRFVL